MGACKGGEHGKVAGNCIIGRWGGVLLILAVLVRARFGDRYELKAIDLVLLLLPLLFVALVSGKLKVLDAFGVKADFSELFSGAAQTKIEYQVVDTASPPVDEVVRMVEMASKGGVRQIPDLVARKTEALVFRLGHGGYYGPAINSYVNALYASSFLQYIIVLDEEGKLFGLYNALDLAVWFRTTGDRAYRDFADWLNRAGTGAREELARLPGFVGKLDAVARDMSKRDVLRKMEELGANSLPVVDGSELFVGTVERSRLTSSLILEVADRIESGGRVLSN